MTPMVDGKYGRCGCGRSPTGQCIGWHGLDELELARVQHEWVLREAQEKGLLQGRRKQVITPKDEPND